MSEPESEDPPSSLPRDGSSLKFNRRTFLELLGVSSAFSLPLLSACDDSTPVRGEKLPPPKATFTTTLRRREDLLFLRFDFFGFAPNDEGTKLVREGSGTAYMVVTHAPQHIYERTLLEASPSIPSDPVENR